jgi:hypothetical protein
MTHDHSFPSISQTILPINNTLLYMFPFLSKTTCTSESNWCIPSWGSPLHTPSPPDHFVDADLLALRELGMTTCEAEADGKQAEI